MPDFKAALIADDLTGTNNAGVLVAKQGLSTITVSHENPTFPRDCEVACVDTDSRYVAPDEARSRVAAMARWAATRGARAWCNRVDNLLRGNIGAEIEGMLDHLGEDALVVVSPAFPALGRVIAEGHLLVNGVPVHENPVAAGDPYAPVRESYIPDLIARQFGAAVARIGRDDVIDGKLATLGGQGARVVVVDCSDDDDVMTLAEAMARLDRVAVPVDPGPLSARYLGALRNRIAPRPRGAKVLLAIGSVTPVSQEQVRYLVGHRALQPVWLDPEALITDADTRQRAIDDAIATALDRLGGASALMITTRHPDHEPLDLDRLARDRNLTSHALSKQISDALAGAATSIIERSEGAIGGCFPSGGDVTASLFKVAGAEAIRIIGDVIPLTAYVAFAGGRLDGLRLVTKGGSIGDEDAMELCLDFLLGELSRA